MNRPRRQFLQSAGGLCLIVGDELRFHFKAFSGISLRQGTGPYAGASTGLTLLRRDGFVSTDEYGRPMPPNAASEPGALITHRVTFSGQYLFVKSNAASRELRAEILDADGHPIQLFSLANCVPQSADSCKQAVAWRQSHDLKPLAGKALRFRFQLTAGEFYLFWVSDRANGASHG